MKINLHLMGMASVLLASGLVLPATAADESSRLYFNAEAGANWAQDVDTKIGGLSGQTELDVGTRFGVGVGYNVTKNLGVEFDTGWLWNGIKDSDSSLAHLPFMFNGVFRYPLHSKIETYIGAGVGGVYSILDVDEGLANDNDGDVAFGWQAMAGFRYKFQENMSLGIGYKYLFSSDTEYSIEGAKVKLDNSHNHTFGVVFNMTF